MGIAAALLVVGLLLGFIAGTRARQIVASLTALGDAIKKAFSWLIPESEKALVGAPPTPPLPSARTAGLTYRRTWPTLTPTPVWFVLALSTGTTVSQSDGANDDEKDEDDDDTPAALELDDMLQPCDTDPILAEHPDVLLNPVMLYHIKRAKDEARVAQRRQSLSIEGLTDDEIDRQMHAEDNGGGGGGGKMNALALLISVGARVEPSAGGNSAEAAAMQARKRMQRNVDAFLQRHAGIAKYQPPVVNSRRSARHASMGARRQAASEVALSTANIPHGGEQRQRELHEAARAKLSRRLMRVWEKEQVELATSIAVPHLPRPPRYRAHVPATHSCRHAHVHVVSPVGNHTLVPPSWSRLMDDGRDGARVRRCDRATTTMLHSTLQRIGAATWVVTVVAARSLQPCSSSCRPKLAEAAGMRMQRRQMMRRRRVSRVRRVRRRRRRRRIRFSKHEDMRRRPRPRGDLASLDAKLDHAQLDDVMYRT
jgi:hypothetical protein